MENEAGKWGAGGTDAQLRLEPLAPAVRAGLQMGSLLTKVRLPTAEETSGLRRQKPHGGLPPLPTPRTKVFYGSGQSFLWGWVGAVFLA